MSKPSEGGSSSTRDRQPRQRRRHQGSESRKSPAVVDPGVRHERERRRFRSEIHALIQEAIDRANQGFARTAKRCALCEVSGYYTGPLHAGGSDCNPIAYELQGDGKKLGPALWVALHDGMVEVSLGPNPVARKVARTRTESGWHPISLQSFSATDASDLVNWYVAAAVTARLARGRGH